MPETAAAFGEMTNSIAGGVARHHRISETVNNLLPGPNKTSFSCEPKEILLRLPPQPSSLPRASSVCKRWRRLATEPQFLRRFRARHRKPPLLGVFEYRKQIVFSPILDPPDRIPPERFDLRCDDDDGGCVRTEVLGCRAKELVGRMEARSGPGGVRAAPRCSAHWRRPDLGGAPRRDSRPLLACLPAAAPRCSAHWRRRADLGGASRRDSRPSLPACLPPDAPCCSAHWRKTPRWRGEGGGGRGLGGGEAAARSGKGEEGIWESRGGGRGRGGGRQPQDLGNERRALWT